MSAPNGINTGVDIPGPSPIRATSSTRIGCNDLLKDKDTGAIQSISFEFRKLEELYNRSPSGSLESQPNFEAQYADIPEALRHYRRKASLNKRCQNLRGFKVVLVLVRQLILGRKLRVE
jgi:hypothetical protein